MQTLAMLLICAAPPPQSTLPAHVPCEVRPQSQPADTAPARKPAAQIEEYSDKDPTRKDTPKGVPDGRQYASLPPTLQELSDTARTTGRTTLRQVEYTPSGDTQWFSADATGRVTKVSERTKAAQSVPRREVAVRQPFRDVYRGNKFVGRECEYDPDHVCNRCGTVQLVIDHWNPDGTHTHRCPRCSHTWRH